MLIVKGCHGPVLFGYDFVKSYEYTIDVSAEQVVSNLLGIFPFPSGRRNILDSLPADLKVSLDHMSTKPSNDLPPPPPPPGSDASTTAAQTTVTVLGLSDVSGPHTQRTQNTTQITIEGKVDIAINNISSTLTGQTTQQLKDLLTNYAHLFQWDKFYLGRTNRLKFEIDTGYA